MRRIRLTPAAITAIQAGTKTQVRYPMEVQPSAYVPSENHHPTKRTAPYFDSYCSERKTPENPRGMSKHWCWWSPDNRQGPDWIECPYGVPGELFEVIRVVPVLLAKQKKMKPLIEPELRLLLQNLRVERIQDVSHEDMRAEGMAPVRMRHIPTMSGKSESHPVIGVSSVRANFHEEWMWLWEPTYPWASNPWVWVLEFTRSAGA